MSARRVGSAAILAMALVAVACGGGGSGSSEGNGGGSTTDAGGSGGNAGGTGGQAATTWVGLWDGASQRSGGEPLAPVSFQILVDDRSRVFLADGTRSVRGWGTISGSGEILIAVDGALVGEGDGTVSYSGTILGDAGSGIWVSSTSTSGTWTVTRRPGVDVSSDCSAHCDDLAPCLAAPDDDPNLTAGNCAFTCALPTPSEGVLFERFAECGTADGCAGLWSCFGAGTVDPVYVSPGGDDANDGSTPTGAKRTLNAAIAAVSADGTVRVATGNYPETVVLTKPLTLEGGYDPSFETFDPEGGPVVIDAGARDRAITTFAPNVSSGRVVLRGLSITHGLTPDAGAGMALFGGLSELVMEDCVVADNETTGDGGGGGIAVGDVTLSITRCVIEDNVSAGNAGGGIGVSRSTVTISDSIIRNNQVTNHGGGINLWESLGSITGCEITGNTAGISGGGISFSDDCSLGSSTVTGNTPNDVSGL